MKKTINLKLFNNPGILMEQVFSVSDKDIKDFITNKLNFIDSEPEDAKIVGKIIPIEVALMIVINQKISEKYKREEYWNEFITQDVFVNMPTKEQLEKQQEFYAKTELLSSSVIILSELLWCSIGLRFDYSQQEVNLLGVIHGGDIVAYKYPICRYCDMRHDPQKSDECILKNQDDDEVIDYFGLYKKPRAQA